MPSKSRRAKEAQRESLGAAALREASEAAANDSDDLDAEILHGDEISDHPLEREDSAQFLTPTNTDESLSPGARLRVASHSEDPPDTDRSGHSGRVAEATLGHGCAALGSQRHVIVTVQLGSGSVAAESPSSGRLELGLTGLGYRRANRVWLMEAQQACAAQFGGRFAGAASAAPACRGAGSLNGVVSCENQLSLCSCTLRSYPAANGCQSNGAVCKPDILLEPTSTKEEVFLLVWQSNTSEPCSQGMNSQSTQPHPPVWPLEAVVRGIRLLYIRQQWTRVRCLLAPVLGPAPQDEKHSAGPDAPTATGHFGALRAKALGLRSVELLLPAEEAAGGGLPLRARIQSAGLENVLPDLLDLQQIFGLVRSEGCGAGAGGAGAAKSPALEDMTVEELREEVRMWRLRNGR